MSDRTRMGAGETFGEWIDSVDDERARRVYSFTNRGETFEEWHADLHRRPWPE